MASRKERLRRRRERAKQSAESSREKIRQAAENTQDDMLQAVSKRKGTVFCEALGGDIKLSALSLSEQGEIKEEALRYYRRSALKARIDDLTVMKDSELITDEEFTRQLDDAREEVRVYSFDDMPPMTVEYGEGRKHVRQTVPYEHWFMANTKDGQITAVLVSLHEHHPDITHHDLEQVMSRDPEFFMQAAEVIQEVTQSLIAKKSRRQR
jgi:hypothetical protein